MIGYIGTYTKEHGKGIYQFDLDLKKGVFGNIREAAETPNATYLDIHKDRLYAVKKGKTKSGIATYDISDPNTGDLNLIEDCLEEGASGCHLTLTSDKNYLVDAVYLSGEIRLYRVDERGVVTERLDVFQIEGDGPHERQDSPHSHFVVETPDRKYIAAVDLGADKIVTLEIKDDQLVKVAESSVTAGSGPRHLVFDNNGRYAYIFTELSNEVIVAAYEDGKFSTLKTYSALPDSFNGHSQGAAIRKHPNGRFIYVSNRGHDSIAVFEIISDGKELKRIQIESTNGDWPRDFNITPDGNFLVCAHERSHNVVLFKINEAGTIVRQEGELEAPEGVFVGFL